MYDEIARNLQAAYDRQVDEREASVTQPWKVDVRQRFLELLCAEKKHRLIEIGAGTGVHGLFFQQSGFEVVATDLSRAMVDSCRAKGLDAREQDFLTLDFSEKFDAVFAMNCLLHVATGDLREVLTAIQRILNPDGLFFWGQYGGVEFQGVLDTDHYRPKRFFSMLTDADLLSRGGEVFDQVSFAGIEVSRDWEQHFQSSIWRKKGA